MIIRYTRLIFFSIFTIALAALFIVPLPRPAGPHGPFFGSHWQFLTVWNQTIQLVVFGYFILFGREERTYHSLMERLFVISAASSVVVVCMFWGLVFRGEFAGLEKVIPPWLNHAQHTLPIFATLSELFLHKHNFGSLRRDIQDVLLYGAAYGCWILVTYSQNRYWPYPFLQQMNAIEWTIMVGSTFGFLVLAYLLSRGISTIRHTKSKRV